MFCRPALGALSGVRQLPGCARAHELRSSRFRSGATDEHPGTARVYQSLHIVHTQLAGDGGVGLPVGRGRRGPPARGAGCPPGHRSEDPRPGLHFHLAVNDNTSTTTRYATSAASCCVPGGPSSEPRPIACLPKPIVHGRRPCHLLPHTDIRRCARTESFAARFRHVSPARRAARPVTEASSSSVTPTPGTPPTRQP